jgi:hypothetical protein
VGANEKYKIEGLAFSPQQVCEQWMRGYTEGIGYGNAIPSKAFLQIFGDEQAAAAFCGGREDDAVPEAEPMSRGKFRSADDHGL